MPETGSIQEAAAVFRSPWLNTKDAAAYLSASPKTLAVWRCQGKGPGTGRAAVDSSSTTGRTSTPS